VESKLKNRTQEKRFVVCVEDQDLQRWLAKPTQYDWGDFQATVRDRTCFIPGTDTVNRPGELASWIEKLGDEGYDIQDGQPVLFIFGTTSGSENVRR